MSREEQPASTEETTVTVTAEAPTTDVQYGETVTVGRKSSGWGVAGQLATVLGESWFVKVGDAIYTTCGNCDLGYSGSIAHYAGILGGICFRCNGTGVTGKVGTEEEAIRKAKRRIADRARRARKAAEQAAAELAAGVTWRAANAALAAQCEAIYAELSAANFETNAAAAYAAADAVEQRWGGFVTKMANLVGMGRPLTPNQTVAVADAIDKARAEQTAEQARQDASRWYGAEKDKAVATGTIATAMNVETTNPGTGMPQTKRLVIIEGTGDFTGVTFKIFGIGKTLWETERGQSVQVKGTVKGHGERDGVKQTELTRATITTA